MLVPGTGAGERIAIELLDASDARADNPPVPNGLRGRLEDRQSAAQPMRLMVVVDQDRSVRVTGEAVHLQACHLKRTSAGVTQNDVGGVKHHPCLFVAEHTKGNIAPKEVRRGVELALNHEGNGLRDPLGRWIGRDHPRGIRIQGRRQRREVPVTAAVLDQPDELVVLAALMFGAARRAVRLRRLADALGDRVDVGLAELGDILSPVPRCSNVFDAVTATRYVVVNALAVVCSRTHAMVRSRSHGWMITPKSIVFRDGWLAPMNPMSLRSHTS